MKKNLRILILISFLKIISFDCYSQKWVWANKIGLDGGGNDYGLAIAKDKDKNVMVTGRVKGNSTFGTGAGAVTLNGFGDRDIYISKYDSLGNFVWARRYGGISSDYGYGIATDKNSNIFITGNIVGPAYFENDTLKGTQGGDIFAAKVSPSGKLLWAKSWGGTGDDFASSIAVDKEGNSFITGDFYATVIFGKDTLKSAGNNDIFITKLDPDGNCVWAKRAGNTGTDDSRSIVINSSGTGIYLTGYYQQTISFGNKSLTNYGSSDIFLVKYDADGTCIWAKNAGSSYTEYGDAIDLDQIGNLYMTGNYFTALNFGTVSKPVMITAPPGGQGVFLAKYDTLGVIVWAKMIAAGTASALGDGLSVNKFNNPVICGYFEATCNFDGQPHTVEGDSHDGFVSEFDSKGSIVWFKSYKGIVKNAINAAVHAVITDNTEHTYIAGGFLDTVSFDGIKLIAAGASSDVLIAKISPFVKAEFKSSAREVCTGIGIEFTDVSRGFPSSWEWSFPGAVNITSTVINPSVTYNSAGKYSVQLIINNGIERDTILIPDYITVNDCTVGLNDLNGIASLSISPNPFTESCELTVNGLQSGFGSFKMFNLFGQCVKQIEIRNTQKLQIERGNLSAGVYIYQLYDNNAVVKMGKIIID
jgi:PKD repeat protein